MNALRRIALVALLPVTMAVTSLLFDKPSAEAAIDCDYRCYWNGLYAGCFDPTIVRNCLGCDGATCSGS